MLNNWLFSLLMNMWTTLDFFIIRTGLLRTFVSKPDVYTYTQFLPGSWINMCIFREAVLDSQAGKSSPSGLHSLVTFRCLFLAIWHINGILSLMSTLECCATALLPWVQRGRGEHSTHRMWLDRYGGVQRMGCRVRCKHVSKRLFAGDCCLNWQVWDVVLTCLMYKELQSKVCVAFL